MIKKEFGKKSMREENLVSLIKYEGDNSYFVWKHPIEDFKYGSQLIVHDSQEALFFAGGEAYDLFQGGTYSLTTELLPILSKIYKAPSGEGTFHTEIYFINKAIHTGIRWGTSSRIKLFDPASGMHISIGVSGQFNMKVLDSRRLILKLIGTTDVFSHAHNVDTSASETDKTSKPILDYIKSVIVTKVRTHMANTIKERGYSILELDAYLEDLSEGIKEKINLDLEEYGLMMPQFFILNISTPEDSEDEGEKNDYLTMKRQYGQRYLNIKQAEINTEVALAEQKHKMVEAETEAKMQVIQSQGEAESMRIKGFAEAEVQKAQGYTGKDKLSYDVQKTFAENIGSTSGGDGLGSIIGLGAGLGAISSVSKTVGGMFSESINVDGWTCSCGAVNHKGRFCSECGKARNETPVSKNATWNCSCGAVNQEGKFCSECGKRRELN